jgi:hypothetical protein
MVRPEFIFNSVQEHLTIKNGKPVGHSKHVAIRDGKGTKTCVSFCADGKQKTQRKALTKKELAAIKKHEYIPALFKDVMLGSQLLRFSRTKKNRRQK